MKRGGVAKHGSCLIQEFIIFNHFLPCYHLMLEKYKKCELSGFRKKMYHIASKVGSTNS